MTRYKRSLKMKWQIVCILTLFLFGCGNSVYERTANGVIIYPRDKKGRNEESVRVQVVSENIIRVTSVTGNTFPEVKSLMTAYKTDSIIDFSIERGDDNITLQTGTLNVSVSTKTGEVAFADPEGKVILSEKNGGGRTFSPVVIGGNPYYTVRQQFEPVEEEALYGLGSNQTSFMNMKGKDADLFQYNTQAVVPFVLSTKNYGILWDNNSRSKFGDIKDYREISSLKLYGKDGTEGNITATYFSGRDGGKVFTTRGEKEISYQFIPDLKKFPEGYDLNTGSVTWEGSIASAVSGLHRFMFTSAGYAKLWVDGKLVFDRWRQCWNTSSNRFDLLMEKDKKYPVRVEWIPDGGESFIALRYLEPLDKDDENSISFFSEAARHIDYYFVHGATMDEVISGYRFLTGRAPVMPKWAMGFWQSRERYKTQDEVLATISEFRKREIPIDNIVLDWQYWPIDKWGDHDFDSERFSDPADMVHLLHNTYKANIMISVWPKYYVGTDNYEKMNASGWLYRRNIEKSQKDWLGYVSTFYDAFNPDARAEFWNQVNMKLYSKSIDAWWLDATEPDICSNLPMEERKALMDPTAAGPASEYFNAFSLVNAQAVYEGQRKTNPDSRVFILTRSAFAGLQRYSAANWSGDIAARWHDMKAQIPCGLNFSMSGIPYWTMDIGGFAVENRFANPEKNDLEEWRELMTRWYQFGAFCPIFRSHGQYPYREIFNVAPENHPAYRTMVSYDRLRYRLMPYIYSLAGHVWLDDYTIMRGLAMDFPEDTAVFDTGDQYLFGPSLMICPVYEHRARSRDVYLPGKCGWYDLYTGIYHNGGKTVSADAPLERMPVFVREGSILPFGPEMQYTSEKPSDPLTLFVYTGADGSFTIYEDEGVNNNYEAGAYSLIPLIYNESEKSLTIGKRQGEFSGMLRSRAFRIVSISKDKPVGLDFEAAPARIIDYQGEEISVRL